MLINFKDKTEEILKRINDLQTPGEVNLEQVKEEAVFWKDKWLKLTGVVDRIKKMVINLKELHETAE